MKKVSFTEEETFNIGKEIGANAKKGDIYAVTGGIGAGKTVFSKGFAKGLGIEDMVTSPTFAIVHVYENADITFHHFDVYRIYDSSEMEETGFYDYIETDGVTLIEWADMIEDILPERTKWIDFTFKEDGSREISFRS